MTGAIRAFMHLRGTDVTQLRKWLKLSICDALVLAILLKGTKARLGARCFLGDIAVIG